jgi:hypothetical protein
MTSMAQWGHAASQPMTPQQYQQQQLQDQQRYWVNEFEQLRDAYTPQTAQMTVGQPRQHPYRFQVRPYDLSCRL